MTGFQIFHCLGHAGYESKTHRLVQCTLAQVSTNHIAMQTDLHCLHVVLLVRAGLLQIHYSLLYQLCALATVNL